MQLNTVSLHRVLKATPDKVFRAFTDPKAMAFWLPPNGFLCTVHHMDAREGGMFCMSFHNFTTGHTHTFGGTYLSMVQDQFLKYTNKFDDPNLPGEMTVSIELNKVSVGTEIKILQQDIPEKIPVEMCYLGWQESLEKLAKLVEPIIKDA